jgi:hypothetical protein
MSCRHRGHAHTIDNVFLPRCQPRERGTEALRTRICYQDDTAVE